MSSNGGGEDGGKNHRRNKWKRRSRSRNRSHKRKLERRQTENTRDGSERSSAPQRNTSTSTSTNHHHHNNSSSSSSNMNRNRHPSYPSRPAFGHEDEDIPSLYTDSEEEKIFRELRDRMIHIPEAPSRPPTLRERMQRKQSIPGFYFCEERQKYFPMTEESRVKKQQRIQQENRKQQQKLTQNRRKRQKIEPLSIYESLFLRQTCAIPTPMCLESSIYRTFGVWKEKVCRWPIRSSGSILDRLRTEILGTPVAAASALAWDEEAGILYTAGEIGGGRGQAILAFRMNRRDCAMEEKVEDEALDTEYDAQAFHDSIGDLPFLRKVASSAQDNVTSSICVYKRRSESVLYTHMGCMDTTGSFHYDREDFSNTFHLRTGSMFCCASHPTSQAVSMGCSKGGYVFDLEKWRYTSRIYSGNKDIMCQDMSTHTVLNGTRQGWLVLCDTRQKEKRRRKMDKRGTMPYAVSWVQYIQNHNGDATQFLSSAIDGSMRLWDLRMTGPVREYEPQVNNSLFLHAAVDPLGDCFHSVGWDGSLRTYGISSGALMNTLYIGGEGDIQSRYPIVVRANPYSILIGRSDAIVEVRPNAQDISRSP